MQLRILLTGLLILFTAYVWFGHPMTEEWPTHVAGMVRRGLAFCQEYKKVVSLLCVVSIVSIFVTYQKY